jgi:hypothetical protein
VGMSHIKTRTFRILEWSTCHWHRTGVVGHVCRLYESPLHTFKAQVSKSLSIVHLHVKLHYPKNDSDDEQVKL